jgi:hypothetical protein
MTNGSELDPITASIALMEAQIAKWQAALDALREVQTMRGQTSSAGSFARSGADPNFGHDAFFGMTAAEAGKKYLSAIKKTATPKTIADALQAGGWKTASKNVPENVRTILNRNSAFVVINGEFGLSEWYPGRKSATKSRAATATSSSEEESTEDESSSSSSENES